ncbi:MAG: NAD(P)-dependent oxidoreductase [Gammaproteobacteria bacterium]|nr:NAD(P)-dependent oxidoreductase [Gammaproteobacteria bacterium]|tara:strand:+ start:8895 stop:9794 length:900 start_codon:yes stop_codon:yes gene_type:complete
MKKIFIAGCGGMLGEAFYKVYSDEYELKCTDIDLNAEWLSYLDFRDFDAYQAAVEDFNSDYLFHLGAFTDLEYCENHIDKTYSTNTLSVENATLIANKLDIPILYISTAGIFDGAKDLYDDWDVPNPVCHYARSKYAGELYVKLHAKRYLILRAGWMMGGGPSKDKKFVAKILKQLKNGSTELNVVDDKLGTPTYTMDFAENSKLILSKEIWGLYNLVCEGLTGRYEVASEILKVLSLESSVKLNQVSSDFFKEEYFAPRPPSERLVNKKLELRGLNFMRDWKVCLKEYLEEYYEGYLK